MTYATLIDGKAFSEKLVERVAERVAEAVGEGCDGVRAADDKKIASALIDSVRKVFFKCKEAGGSVPTSFEQLLSRQPRLNLNMPQGLVARELLARGVCDASAASVGADLLVRAQQRLERARVHGEQ